MATTRHSRRRASFVATALALLALHAFAGAAHAQFIRMAGIGANEGNQAANEVFDSGDLVGSIDRIDEATFNAMSPADLRASYDVLLFTWNSGPLDADWATRILPYLALGGGVLWEDQNNTGDLFPGVSGGESNGGGDVAVSATVPGLTDGIVGDPGGFDNYHIAFTSWTAELQPFLIASGQIVGLYGTFPGGGRVVLTGPDQDYHAHRPGNQYQLLVNAIRWVAPSCDTDADCPALGCLQAGTCNLESRRCERPPVADGTGCNDGDACTRIDQCVAGACRGDDRVVCTALDQCHFAGSCNVVTGLCSNPVRTNGSPCSTGDDIACSQPDTCQAGICRAGGGGDPDDDLLCALDDNCPVDYDPTQSDLDDDGQGDVCDGYDGALSLIDVRIRRSTVVGSSGSNGSVLVKGDLFAAVPDLFTASNGIALSVSDALELDVSTAPAAFTAADCVTRRNGMILCRSADRRNTARFKPLRSTPQIWQMKARLSKAVAVPPFAGPVTVKLTYGVGVDRSGRIGGCASSATGMYCDHALVGSASAAFLAPPVNLFDF